MTPSRIGFCAVMFPGVRPSMSRASSPTATMRGRFDPFSCASATTDGSVRTMPFPRTYTMTFAVPRSMPICFANMRVQHVMPDGQRALGRTVHGQRAPARTAHENAGHARPLGAGCGEDHVGGEAEDESEEDAPGGELLVPELARDSEELDDDIEDRS